MNFKRILASVLLAVILCLNLTSCSEFANAFITEFNKQITEDSLTGEHSTSAEDVVNEITENKIRAVVTVKTTFTSINYGWGPTRTAKIQCTGVVISYKGQLLVLTNNHAVNYETGYIPSEITLIDCQGNEMDAEVYTMRGCNASAPEYDLACLYVPKLKPDHPAFTLADINPKINEKVVSISTPEGQPNAIFFGKVLTYAKANIVDTDTTVSNVTADVIWHSAKIKQGSSGGALINYNLELVGINFAGSKTDDNRFTEGCAVPIEMVREFLEKYV